MKNTRLILFITSLMTASMAMSQSSVVNNNKPLGFINPALQNTEMETAVVSASFMVNPLGKTTNLVNYMAIAELKIASAFRVGLHSSAVNTRLNKRDVHKIYGSFNYEFEQGNFLLIGVEGGLMTDMAKVAEFNKVYAPTIHSYEDSVSRDFDIGFGIGYTNQNFTVAVSFNRLNKPRFVGFPTQHWAYELPDSTSIVKKDTSIILTDEEFLDSKINSNFSMIYKWSTGNIDLQHIFQVTNLGFIRDDFAGYDFIGLQNFVTFNDLVVVGLGVYDNGNTSYTASLGYNINERFKIEATTFIKEEFEYNPEIPFPTPEDWDVDVSSTGAYESVGFVPSFELNAQYTF